MAFDWTIFWRALTSAAFARGALTALSLALASHAVAIFLSAGLAAAVQARSRALRAAARAYIAVGRAVPLLLVLLFLWNALPQVSPVFREAWFTPWLAALIGLSLVEAAYQVEINRAALAAVPAGQREAGRALGLSRTQITLLVVLPQALRVALPPSVNELITLLKATSLATVISLQELLTITQQAVAVSFRYAEYYLAALAYYVAIVLALTLVQSRIERSFAWASPSHTRGR